MRRSKLNSAAQLYADGFSLRKIAEKLGVDYHQVRNCLLKSGVKLRDVRQAQAATFSRRFWSRVKKLGPNDCWEWQGSVTEDGHGHLSRDGVLIYAHRVAYEFAHGPIPEGIRIRHKCDNPPCCNDAHLLPGTIADNNRDTIERGRFRAVKGKANGNSRISEAIAARIRQLIDQGVRQRDIAAQFKISKGTVHNVAHNIYWKV